MAPIDILPPEILAEILKVAQPPKRSRYWIPYEVMISHVSSHWRDVALDTPQLWTRIDIYSLHSLAWIPSYLARSSTLPIDVRFDIWQSDRSSSSIPAATTILPLIEATLPHIERWQSLMLFTYQRRTARTILSRMSKATAPTLQRLRVSVDGSDDFGPSNNDATVDTFFAGGASQLLCAEIDGLWYLPPLGNLTALELHASIEALPLSYIDFSIIANTAPHLAHLAIRGVVDVSRWPTPAALALEMPSIRSLLFSNENMFSTIFLTSVAVPNLQSLWMDYPNHAIPESFFNSPMFSTANNFPALRYLTLQSYDFYGIEFLARVFPSVTHLHLAYCNTSHIRYLRDALLNKDHRWWPHLHAVAIQTTRDHYVEKLEQTFEEITGSRVHDGMPIKKLFLDLHGFLALSKSNTLQEHTKLEELGPTNYSDPRWIMAHEDTMVRV